MGPMFVLNELASNYTFRVPVTIIVSDTAILLSFLDKD
jgi:hypothetical protein